jgi:hypothetical protein
LVIDACPQANLSELLLGGLEGKGSNNLETLQRENPRRTIAGYLKTGVHLIQGRESQI